MSFLTHNLVTIIIVVILSRNFPGQVCMSSVYLFTLLFGIYVFPLRTIFLPFEEASFRHSFKGVS